MMRVVALTALVGAVKAGLTQSGLACGESTTVTAQSRLCEYPTIAATIEAEVAATGATVTETDTTNCALTSGDTDFDAATDGSCADTASAVATCAYVDGVYAVTSDSCTSTLVAPTVATTDTSLCTLDPSDDLGVTPGTCANVGATATCAYVAGTYSDTSGDGTLDTIDTADSCTSTLVAPTVATTDTSLCTLDPSTDFGVTPGTCANVGATATCAYVAGSWTVTTADSCTSTLVAPYIRGDGWAATDSGTNAGCLSDPLSTTECPCWSCLEFGTDPFSPMTADNTDEQIALAGKLTVMSPAASDACAEVCGMGAMNGPVVVAPVTSGDGVTEFTATASWCGLWATRQAGSVTCKESIFDAKPVLFLTIIGGALLIIFFQCSIMAVVALCADKPEVGDAKP